MQKAAINIGKVYKKYHNTMTLIWGKKLLVLLQGKIYLYYWSFSRLNNFLPKKVNYAFHCNLPNHQVVKSYLSVRVHIANCTAISLKWKNEVLYLIKYHFTFRTDIQLHKCVLCIWGVANK